MEGPARPRAPRRSVLIGTLFVATERHFHFRTPDMNQSRSTMYLLVFAALAYIAAFASVTFGAPLDALAAHGNGLISGADPTLGSSGGAVLAFVLLARVLQAKHADT